MGGLHNVMNALGSLRVSGNPVFLSKRGKIPSSGQHFMNIALVASVKDDGVTWRIEHSVHGNSYLHNTEVWPQVATGLRNRVN